MELPGGTFGRRYVTALAERDCAGVFDFALFFACENGTKLAFSRLAIHVWSAGWQS